MELNEGIKHVLTGYSEGVNFTKKAVENLLKYDLSSIKHDFSQEFDLKEVVKEKLIGEGICYSHCRNKTYHKFINEDPLIGVYYCDKGYISRIVAYWKNKADNNYFISFLRSISKDKVTIFPEDIRIATRYSWDLGIKGKLIMVKQIYWTQNYNKILHKNSEALFLCIKCYNLFTQKIPSDNSLCHNCK